MFSPPTDGLWFSFSSETSSFNKLKQKQCHYEKYNHDDGLHVYFSIFTLSSNNWIKQMSQVDETLFHKERLAMSVLFFPHISYGRTNVFAKVDFCPDGNPLHQLIVSS